MYGNASVSASSPGRDLSIEERKTLRRDLASVAAQTRELLPAEFVVGSEITAGSDGGPRATVAVQPPIGAVVSADYAPDAQADLAMADEERNDIAQGLAASAALQVKQAFPEDEPPAAQ